MTDTLNDCSRAFSLWFDSNEGLDDEGIIKCCAWSAWQAAWSHKDAVSTAPITDTCSSRNGKWCAVCDKPEIPSEIPVIDWSKCVTVEDGNQVWLRIGVHSFQINPPREDEKGANWMRDMLLNALGRVMPAAILSSCPSCSGNDADKPLLVEDHLVTIVTPIPNATGWQ